MSHSRAIRLFSLFPTHLRQQRTISLIRLGCRKHHCSEVLSHFTRFFSHSPSLCDTHDSGTTKETKVNADNRKNVVLDLSNSEVETMLNDEEDLEKVLKVLKENRFEAMFLSKFQTLEFAHFYNFLSRFSANRDTTQALYKDLLDWIFDNAFRFREAQQKETQRSIYFKELIPDWFFVVLSPSHRRLVEDMQNKFKAKAKYQELIGRLENTLYTIDRDFEDLLDDLDALQNNTDASEQETKRQIHLQIVSALLKSSKYEEARTVLNKYVDLKTVQNLRPWIKMLALRMTNANSESLKHCTEITTLILEKLGIFTAVEHGELTFDMKIAVSRLLEAMLQGAFNSEDHKFVLDTYKYMLKEMPEFTTPYLCKKGFLVLISFIENNQLPSIIEVLQEIERYEDSATAYTNLLVALSLTGMMREAQILLKDHDLKTTCNFPVLVEANNYCRNFLKADSLKNLIQIGEEIDSNRVQPFKNNLLALQADKQNREEAYATFQKLLQDGLSVDEFALQKLLSLYIKTKGPAPTTLLSIVDSKLNSKPEPTWTNKRLTYYRKLKETRQLVS